jgi:hypothetical protein
MENPNVDAADRTAAPLVVLRAAFWATSLLLSPELRLYDDHLELHVPHLRRRDVHRVGYDRVRGVELVEGRLFTDVIIATDDGEELVVPGIRNRDLALARPYLDGLIDPRHDGADRA